MREAAQDLTKLGASDRYVELVDYYSFRGPSKTDIDDAARKHQPHPFDSGLLDGDGVASAPYDKRPAYCVLVLGIANASCPPKAKSGKPVAGSLTAHASTVSMAVAPNGVSTSYWVEYGTTTEYGLSTSHGTVGNSEGEQSETAELTGLAPCTTYHYQAEAENEANEGTPSLGGDKTFTTGGCGLAPTVITGPAFRLPPDECFGEHNLELTGEVNPNGLATTYNFEYSENNEGPIGPEHPAEFTTPAESAGSGSEQIKVDTKIKVKDPIIQCWIITYRLTGTNAAGTSYGESVQEHETI